LDHVVLTIGSLRGSTVMSDEISEASGFRFLFRDESPDRAVLEFDTATNPFGCCCQRSNWIA